MKISESNNPKASEDAKRIYHKLHFGAEDKLKVFEGSQDLVGTARFRIRTFGLFEVEGGKLR